VEWVPRDGVMSMMSAVPSGLYVKVYWNLHKHCYSIRHDHKVIAHTNNINLIDVTFKVSEASRQRVLRDRRKNVHAFVEGITVESAPDVCAFVQYDPYRYCGFVLTGDVMNIPLTHADSIAMITVGNSHPLLIASNVR